MNANWLDNLVSRNAKAVIGGLLTLAFWAAWLSFQVVSIADCQKELLADFKAIHQDVVQNHDDILIVKQDHKAMELEISLLKQKND